MNIRPLKVCPLVLRHEGCTAVLAFEHPQAGLQLVKGSLELAESPAQAAVRELQEESGLLGHAVRDLGVWDSGLPGQVWSFQLCVVQQLLPDTWVHHTLDDGGHDFRFFWHPLAALPSDRWHVLFQRALVHVQGLAAAGLLPQDAGQRSPLHPARD